MYDFICDYWLLLLIVAGVLLFGLIGYFIDRKKYQDYREEILNEGRAIQTMEADINVSNIAPIISMGQPQVNTQNDPVTGTIQN